MSIRLRDLIRNVRACKTAADERGVISKECAAIRTAFKDEDNQYRFRNVAKLLYIHMLGYPTYFGQMECLKLIASPKFPEKRIGYLGLMLLLDDRQEVLNLVENSLRNDLYNSNQYIVGLALCSLGNVCNDEMARDLLPDVEKLNRSPNPYIKKKASLVMIRIFRRIPELINDYHDKISIPDKPTAHHGMTLTAVSLLIDICETNPNLISHYRHLVPQLVRLLKDLVTPEYKPEYDIMGITDPFLHCKVLRLLRLLGTGNASASEQMNDILAQIATNTETLKNPGNAIVYECVQTIMAIDCDSGLRVLAINILGRFLLNRDNNIRYVALNTLVAVVHLDIAAVQRHRTTILECLKDPDISIRRRALDLTYMLVTETNIEPMARELLNYLTVADPEFKEDLTTKLYAVVERHAPNKRWHIDTVLQILILGVGHVREDVGASAIALISQTPELYAYMTRRLYAELSKIIQHQAIVQVGAWSLGEYADLLVSGQGNENDGLETPTQDQVVSLLDKILKSGFSNQATRQICITSLTKLISRFSPPAESPLHQRIVSLIDPYRESINLEMQQRSCEFFVLFQPKFDNLRSGILDVMPVVDTSARVARGGSDERAQTSAPAASSRTTSAPAPARSAPAPQAPAPAVVAQKGADLLFDLLSDTPAPAPMTAPTQAPVSTGADVLLGLLDDIPSTPAPVMGMNMSGGYGMGGMGMGVGMGGMGQGMGVMGGMGMGAGLVQQQIVPQMMSTPMVSNGSLELHMSASPKMLVYSKNGLNIEFQLSKSPSTPSQTQVDVQFTNTLSTNIEGLVFQAAVPKYCKVQMSPASSQTVPANRSGVVTQSLRILNSQYGQSPAKVLMRVVFRANGQEIQDTHPVDLPPGH